MAKPGQSSFRRTLLFRILLLSIPVLLAGEYFTYQKARSSLLKTTRESLKESAVRKGENIQDLIEVFRSKLVSEGEALLPHVGSPQDKQDFIRRMAQRLPKGGECIQLTNQQTGILEHTTCGNQPLSDVLEYRWGSQSQALLDPLSNVQIVPNVRSLATAHTVKGITTLLRQPDLVFSTPIYNDNDPAGSPNYVLSIQAALPSPETSQRGSLSAGTVIIDQNGVILAHPITDYIGRNIREHANLAWLEALLQQATISKQGFLSFHENGEEQLAGYNSIQVLMGPGKTQTWVILAVAPLNNALSGLQEIKHVLVVLTLGLIAANLLATLYIARDLARPLEQLGSYALHIFQRHPSERAPKNFKIRELNQLAEALDSMVEQLEERAEELETAWQEAQVANQLKSEFLATTSHELRTPLNAIIGCVRLVRDGCCDSQEEELEFLQQADEAAIHLLKIINDLLDIAKIEAGKVELNLQPVSIQDLCQQCLRMVQPAAEKKHLALSQHVSPNLNRIPLDERRVRQMVINLLSNAVKFTPEGGQVKLQGWVGYGYQLAQDIRPDHSPVNASTPYICLEVADTGIGIPRERWHLLFRPFQQIDSSLTRKHEGTGLGLALTKRLAELHGGTISFQSVPGKGSTFRIWLPSREAQLASESVILDESTVMGSERSDSADSMSHRPVSDPSVSTRSYSSG